jgi:hypothetical protein
MADRFPPELFQRILKWVAAEGQAWRTPWLSKRELSSCSLVCRYWGKSCRQPIFDRLTLRTRRDASLLISFVKADTGVFNIEQYLGWLELEQSSSDCTWAHHIIFLLLSSSALKRRPPTLTLTIRGDHTEIDGEARTLYPCRRLFGDLPKPLLSSSTHLAYIVLTDLHFKNISDVLRSLKLHRMCRRVVCRRLSLEDGWNFTPFDVSLNARRSSPRRAATSLDVEDCQLLWPFLSPLLYTSRQPRPGMMSAAYVHETELPNLLSIVGSVISALGISDTKFSFCKYH